MVLVVLVPLFSDIDLVSKQIAFHSFGLVSEISLSMFRSSHVIGHSLSCLMKAATSECMVSFKSSSSLLLEIDWVTV